MLLQTTDYHQLYNLIKTISTSTTSKVTGIIYFLIVVSLYSLIHKSMFKFSSLQVHYTARFADGRVFDSSYKRARPLTMRIGVGKAIKIICCFDDFSLFTLRFVFIVYLLWFYISSLSSHFPIGYQGIGSGYLRGWWSTSHGNWYYFDDGENCLFLRLLFCFLVLYFVS